MMREKQRKRDCKFSKAQVKKDSDEKDEALEEGIISGETIGKDSKEDNGKPKNSRISMDNTD